MNPANNFWKQSRQPCRPRTASSDPRGSAPLFTLLLFPLLLALTGCQPRATAFEPHVWPQVVYTEASQELAAPLYHVTPDHAGSKPGKALVLPFTISQEIDNPVRIGSEVGRIFWQAWQSGQVFDELHFSNTPSWPDTSSGLQRARDLDVDAVVLGRVTHLLLGGSQGDSSVALQVEVYDAANGRMLWSVEHAGRIERIRDEDFILFVRKSRMPEGSGLVLVRDLALDLAPAVRLWQWPLPETTDTPCATNSTPGSPPDTPQHP